MKIKTGDLIAFIKDIKSNVGRHLILKANIPVKVVSINNSAVIIRLPNGRPHSVRNMPERMYKIKSKLGRTLYG